MFLSFPRDEIVGELEWQDSSAPATGVVEVPDGVPVTLYVSGDEPVSLGFLRGLPGDSIEELRLAGALVADSLGAVTHLAPGLRYLHLVGTYLGDRALEYVAQLRGLKRLYCLGNEFTGTGLRQLAALENLEYLALEEERLSVSDIEFAVSMPHLKELTGLGESGMDEAELSRLRALIPWVSVR